MRYYSIIISFALLAVASCSKVQENEAEEGKAAAQRPVETKVVQLSDEYNASAFQVKFETVPTTEMLSAIQEIEGIASIEPLFVSRNDRKELEHQFGLDRWYYVRLEENADVHQLVRETAGMASVSMAEYECYPQKASDGIAYPAEEVFSTKASVPGSHNDPMLIDQWHYNNQGSKAYSRNAVKGADVNVKDVWATLTCGDPDIIVAVVDEAVCYTNPDLAANMWVNTGEIPDNGIDDDNNGYVDDIYGYNFVDNNGNVNWDDPDDSGHGSHTGGTIAAVSNNGKGVAGLAGGSGKGDGCRLMSCQIFSGNRGGNSAKAIKYAADNGASIISCSYGFKAKFTSDNNYLQSQGSLEIDAIHYFEACKNNPVLNGNIAIFSSGNENDPYAHYPGAFYDIISVSAFGPDFLPTYYTDYGPGCNICAPGGEVGHLTGTDYEKSMVLSTLPKSVAGSDYGYMQGTSMACPHVSGVVALALSYAKKLGKTFSVQEFKEMILSSTNDIDQRIANTASKTYPGWKIDDLNLAPYYHQMGTGAIDAWRLMMHIEGTPTSTAQTGRTQWIDLTPLLGTSSTSLTYLSVEADSATIDSMGLEAVTPASDAHHPAVMDASGKACIQFGRLYIHPTKIGSGKFTIRVVGGGSYLGGGDNPPGGMEVTRVLSVISRDAANGGNGNGGWL
ncbi:MAG: S8 family serine peptidase [Bacteroidota bacterium]|nr:S8 family serine peptidase [Bacteroidota bacterium]